MSDELEFTIRPLQREDREWVARFMDEHWGTTQIVSRGQAHYGHLLPGLVAESESHDADGDDATKTVGLITYNIVGDECEITTINSLDEGKGIGTALVDAVVKMMKDNSGVKRVWLIMTNDNMNALRFYQKRNFVLVQVHRDSIKESRRIKPQIPIVGLEGIPIRDEIELEYDF